MQEKPAVSFEPSLEQIWYARFLKTGMYVGLACLFVTFALYAFGIMEPHIPIEKLPEHWTKRVDKYLDEAEIDAGWGWVKMVGYGDFVNFIGIALLAGVTVLCYLAVIPIFLFRRDTIYAVLALLEVLVLVVAASGIIAVGH